MAIYHMHAQVISRKAGRSATAAAAYRAAERIDDQRTGEVHDYTRKGGVDSAEIHAPEDAPVWAHDRAELWNRVEAAERRGDAQLCREIDVAIPAELDDDAKRQLVRDYVQDEFVSRGMVADVAFHDFEDDNPHAHIMLTMRGFDGDEFGKKAREWNDRELLKQWREGWSEKANQALELAGSGERIDHRSYAAQGLPFEPSQHMGPVIADQERRDPGSTRIGRENEARRERNILREVDQHYLEDDQIYVDRLAIELEHLAGEIETAIQALAVERASVQQRQQRQQRQDADRRMIDRALEVRPCPEPQSTEHEGFGAASLKDWYSRLKTGLKGVAERARDYYDRRTHDAAAAKGWTPEQIYTAGLKGSQADAGREALELTEQQRQQRREAAQELAERQKAAIEISNETGHLYQPEDIKRDEKTGEFRPLTQDELEPAKPDSLQAEFERRRAAREDREDEYQGPSMG